MKLYDWNLGTNTSWLYSGFSRSLWQFLEINKIATESCLVSFRNMLYHLRWHTASNGTWYFFFFLVSWGGVRLSPLGTSATNWLLVPAPDDRWWWTWNNQWNDNSQGKPKYSEKTCRSAPLSTTIATWSDMGSNPGRRGGKPANNRLSYGTANMIRYLTDWQLMFQLHGSRRFQWNGTVTFKEMVPAYLMLHSCHTCTPVRAAGACVAQTSTGHFVVITV
jgi:hypothetical protein